MKEETQVPVMIGEEDVGLTTPPAPFDVAKLFPELAGQSKITVRLHPRSGAPSPAYSSLGGPLLWPIGDPWPFWFYSGLTFLIASPL